MRQYLPRFNIGLAFYLRIKRRKVDFGKAEQVVQAVDDEIGFLKIVDAVIGLHHPPQVKGHAVGRCLAESRRV